MILGWAVQTGACVATSSNRRRAGLSEVGPVWMFVPLLLAVAASAITDPVPLPSNVTSIASTTPAQRVSSRTTIHVSNSTTPTQSPNCLEVAGLESSDCSDSDGHCSVAEISPNQYRFTCRGDKGLTEASLRRLPKTAFIRDIDITGAANLTNITSLSNFTHLQNLQLGDNTLNFGDLALSGLTNLGLLDLSNTTLLSGRLPNLDSQIRLHKLRASQSGITALPPGTFLFQPELELLDLSNNRIRRLDAYTFNGTCDLEKLFLQNNLISYVDNLAFNGLKYLVELDLSNNAQISQLPRSFPGFSGLTFIALRNLQLLKALPDWIYQLRKLTTAKLTYAPHCCLFNKPINTSTDGDISLTDTPLEVYANNNCSLLVQTPSVPVAMTSARPPATMTVTNGSTASPNGTHPETPAATVILTTAPPVVATVDQICKTFPTLPNCQGQRRRRRQASDDDDDDAPKCRVENAGGLEGLDVVRDPAFLCGTLELARASLGGLNKTTTWPQVLGTLFSDLTVDAEVNDTREHVVCSPAPDPAFTPCDNLMTWVWLRVLVWCVFVFGFAVNLFVFFVIAFSKRRWDAYRELTLHLVIGDLCIAMFLGVLAVADLSTKDDYAQQALGWQKSAGCQVVGFTSVLGSQLIMATLVVITIERFYKITRHRVLKLHYIRALVYSGWAYAIVCAALPLVGLSDYSTVATCMPFEAADVKSEAFLGTVLALNMAMCLLIVVLYCKVTFSTFRNSRKIYSDTGNILFQQQQFRTLKRSAPLVLCTLVCVIPIAVIGLLSVVLQTAQIDNRYAKVVLVIVYPINCLANPILYGFGRRSVFRDHMYDFLYRRLGLFEKTFHHRRSMVFFHSPTNSRRGSLDSNMSSMSTLRRGLSLPVNIAASVNTPAFRRALSDTTETQRGAVRRSASSSGMDMVAFRRSSSDSTAPPQPRRPVRGPDQDSAYSSSSGRSHRFNCLQCTSQPKSRRPTSDDTDLAEEFARQFAASLYGGTRPSTDTQQTTVSSRSALGFQSPTYAHQLSSPGTLPAVLEHIGHVMDASIQQYESSL